jgi:hypothetical protein
LARITGRTAVEPQCGFLADVAESDVLRKRLAGYQQVLVTTNVHEVSRFGGRSCSPAGIGDEPRILNVQAACWSAFSLEHGFPRLPLCENSQSPTHFVDFERLFEISWPTPSAVRTFDKRTLEIGAVNPRAEIHDHVSSAHPTMSSARKEVPFEP